MDIVSLAFSVLFLFYSISDFSTMGVKRGFFILFLIQNLGNIPKFSFLVRKRGGSISIRLSPPGFLFFNLVLSIVYWQLCILTVGEAERRSEMVSIAAVFLQQDTKAHNGVLEGGLTAAWLD
ncbi:hypothetical protein L211DRAFT_378292 [Terfezia boudieri ATCC MYA-4762]|uniref:Uncharacterized protein n=1 Tax=Terfezia boudieri ATCC MYA-4762 TaxID=1051890 RepID=A0A3N4LZJ3_9PEZI|nr:hypothetical protein L211DRAFT_378292 [Terfezia boudieri ATCC MYA-4762]